MVAGYLAPAEAGAMADKIDRLVRDK
jgi:hypothetical protein